MPSLMRSAALDVLLRLGVPCGAGDERGGRERGRR